MDGHIGGEGDPERIVLDSGVAQSAGTGIDGIGVGGVSDDIELAVLAAESVTAKAKATLGEALPVSAPVRAGAAPAIVNGVSGETLLIFGLDERTAMGELDLPENGPIVEGIERN